MSQAIVCDGCGEFCSSAEQRGRQRRLDYCPDCAALVDARAAQIEALHKDVATRWHEGLAAIDEEARARCPKIRLPL